MNIPNFIEYLVEEGISITLQKGGKFRLEGFYKSSGVSVGYSEEQERWIAHTRYDENTPIDCVDDLIRLNYYWWQRSKDRYDGWAQPEPLWVPLMLRLGLIEEKVIPATIVYE